MTGSNKTLFFFFIFFYKYSFYPRTIIQSNILPIHVHEAVTVDGFKALVPVTVLAPI